LTSDIVVDTLGASEGTGIVKVEVEGKLRASTDFLDFDADFVDFVDFEAFTLRWILSLDD